MRWSLVASAMTVHRPCDPDRSHGPCPLAIGPRGRREGSRDGQHRPGARP
jgi:hypothetical protein